MKWRKLRKCRQCARIYRIDTTCLHCLNDVRAKYEKVEHLWYMNAEAADAMINYKEPELSQKDLLDAVRLAIYGTPAYN